MKITPQSLKKSRPRGDEITDENRKHFYDNLEAGIQFLNSCGETYKKLGVPETKQDLDNKFLSDEVVAQFIRREVTNKLYSLGFTLALGEDFITISWSIDE